MISVERIKQYLDNDQEQLDVVLDHNQRDERNKTVKLKSSKSLDPLKNQESNSFSEFSIEF